MCDRGPCMAVQVGPELEVCGYGCEDHFNELDTVEHSWEVLAVSPSNSIHDGVCDVHDASRCIAVSQMVDEGSTASLPMP